MAAATVFLYGALLSALPIGGHEGDYVYTRLHQFLAEIMGGVFPPMLFADGVAGAGVAFPTFYPPFSHTLGVLFYLLSGSYVVAMNLVLFASILVSVLGMYALALRMTRKRSIALAVALASISFPYRFSLIFVRGAHAEAWSVAWIPIVLLGCWELIRHRRLRWYFPVSLAGLAISHGVMSLYVGILLVAATPLVMCRTGWRGTVSYIGTAVLVTLLVSFFVFPLRAYIPDVMIGSPEKVGATIQGVHAHRIDTGQLFFTDPFRWSGGSAAYGEVDGMSYELGLVHILMLLLLVFSIPHWWRFHRGNLHYLAGLACFLGWLCCVVYMTNPEPFLRRLPSEFQLIQFPWRLLGETGILASICLGIFGMFVPALRGKKYFWWGLAALFVFTVPVTDRVSIPNDRWSNEDIDSEFVRTRPDTNYGFTSFGEYHPLDFPAEGYSLEKLPEAYSLNDNASVQFWNRSGKLWVGNIEATGPGHVVLPILYYGFWNVDVAGRKVDTLPHNGWLAFPYGPGETSFRLWRGIPTVSRWGLLFSAAGLLALPYWLAITNRLLSGGRWNRNRRPR